jgi:hypothetical protein
MDTVTKYVIYFDDTCGFQWSYKLFDDDGNELFESKQYKTNAAAASVASRKIKKCLSKSIMHYQLTE